MDALTILKGAEWKCCNCDLPHRGMFDLASDCPDPWGKFDGYEPNAAIRLEGDFLSEDFCVLGGEHFLARCVVEIPVHGLDRKFGFGCWGSLKRENFESYLNAFDAGSVPDGAPWTSWLSNRIKPFVASDPIGCDMFPQAGRQRPVLRVADRTHPLAQAQESGISPEALIEIYALYGHRLAV
jgi:hypothetical protein